MTYKINTPVRKRFTPARRLLKAAGVFGGFVFVLFNGWYIGQTLRTTPDLSSDTINISIGVKSSKQSIRNYLPAVNNWTIHLFVSKPEPDANVTSTGNNPGINQGAFNPQSDGQNQESFGNQSPPPNDSKDYSLVTQDQPEQPDNLNNQSNANCQPQATQPCDDSGSTQNQSVTVQDSVTSIQSSEPQFDLLPPEN